MQRSLRSKRSRANEFFRILAARKLGREQKIGGRGWEWGGEGTLACKPHDFENRPPICHGWFHSPIDSLSTN